MSEQPFKKLPKNKKFPNNSRIITEHFLRLSSHPLVLKSKQWMLQYKHRFSSSVLVTLWVLISALLVVGIFFLAILVYKAYLYNEFLKTERLQIQKDIGYWQGVVEKYPDYRDGYFKLATLEYKLGNKQKAASYVEKSLLLDPNFKEGRELEKMVRKK